MKMTTNLLIAPRLTEARAVGAVRRGQNSDPLPSRSRSENYPMTKAMKASRVVLVTRTATMLP
jgi:hypothetical protein